MSREILIVHSFCGWFRCNEEVLIKRPAYRWAEMRPSLPLHK